MQVKQGQPPDLAALWNRCDKHGLASNWRNVKEQKGEFHRSWRDSECRDEVSNSGMLFVCQNGVSGRDSPQTARLYAPAALAVAWSFAAVQEGSSNLLLP